MLKILSILFLLAYDFILLLLFAMFAWPEPEWWVANSLSIGPIWPFALPLILTIPALILFKGRRVLLFGNVFALVLLYFITGYVFHPQLDTQNEFSSLNELKVFTANLGNGANRYKALQLIQLYDVDIAAFQEISKKNADTLKKHTNLNMKCVNGLCLLSRYTIKLIKSKSRRFLNDWGQFVAQFEVMLPDRMVTVFVVHLQTPREGLQELIDTRIEGIPLMRKVTKHQKMESVLASNWVADGDNSIVLGDFNMTTRNPIYYRYWSWLENSFSVAGNGFGYSKFSKFHGVRIDHILYSGNQWFAKKSWVEESLGGDHRPVISILASR